MVPDGAIVSTLTDTTTFLKGYFGGRLFPAHHLPQMQRWSPMFFPMEYGYGLWRSHLPKWMSPFTQSPDLIGHAGSTGAFAFYEPNKDLYLVGTFNQIDNPARPFRFMPKVINAL
jgi:CubicO group peptidase (beta-lactamase class C family)